MLLTLPAVSKISMEMIIMCPKDDIAPAIIHHLKGRGNMAYGTKMVKRTYHTKSSFMVNPTPFAAKPERSFKKYSYVP